MHLHAPHLSSCRSGVRRKSHPRVHCQMHPKCTRYAPARTSARMRVSGRDRLNFANVIDFPVFDASSVPGSRQSSSKTKKFNDLRCPTQFLSPGMKIASITLLLTNSTVRRETYSRCLCSAARRRQAHQGERACTQRARRTLSRRSPCTCGPGSDPCPSSCACHQQHGEQIDRLRAREASDARG